MYALGMITTSIPDKTQIALFVKEKWEYYNLKNTIPQGFPEWGLFHYHENSKECYWVNPITIIERAISA
jgi:hypothetical protein